MTTKIGLSGSEATVRDPGVPYDFEILPIAIERRTLDGTLKRHLLTTKRVWRLAWAMLTDVERTALVTELQRESTLVYYGPDAPTTPYTVIVESGSLMISYVETNTWAIEVTLQQV